MSFDAFDWFFVDLKNGHLKQIIEFVYALQDVLGTFDENDAGACGRNLDLQAHKEEIQDISND